MYSEIVSARCELTGGACFNQPSHAGFKSFFFFLTPLTLKTQWLFELQGYGILSGLLSLPNAHTENTTMTLNLNRFSS